jgi:hypothetical protein
MEKKFNMNAEEINQGKIFDQIIRKEKTQVWAASILTMSVRQVRNKLKRYKLFGNLGLIHKSRGKPSPKRLPQDLLDNIFELYDSKYYEFGPTFFAEMLEVHHGIKLDPETLRKYMIENGRWKRARKHKAYRKRRERRDNPGIMTQMDATPFNWFEGRAPECCSLIGIDDATSELLFCELHESESTKSYMIACKNYFKKCGRPHSLYVDHHGVFSVNFNNPEGEKLSQFGRAMKQLDIELILAGSPQAKGRVERAHRTIQDILTKFLRIYKISDIDSANRFIREFFIPYYNKKFSKRTYQHVDMHKPVDGYDLDDILSNHEIRILRNDFTISFNKRVFQLDKQQLTILKPKDKILVQEHLCDSIVLKIRNIILSFQEISIRSIGKPTPVEFVKLERENDLSALPFREIKTINYQGLKNV